jgi:hypothetical protein
MTPPLHVDDWIRCIDADYLRSFLKDGGATVKFAVALDTDAAQQATVKLKAAALHAGYLFAVADARSTRVHLIEHVFFAIAQQVPWEELAMRIVKTLALESGYRWPASSDGSWYETVAQQNGTDQGIVRSEIRQALTKVVYRNASLAKDFRVAMMQMCLATLGGGDEGKTTVARLTEWLTGRNRAVSAVKPYHVFASINRSNARHLLQSLCRWVRMAGYAGVVVLLDVCRLGVQRNPGDEHLFYSKAALLDAFEVLRQFIDGTDELDGVLIAVLAAPFLLDGDSPRGMGVYSALKTRVYDEVKDRRYPNPTGALVRLSTTSQTGVIP